MECKFRVKTKGKPCIHYISPSNKDDPGFCTLPHMFRCIEALKHKLPHISHSSKMLFQRCRYAWYLHYVLGVEVKPEHIDQNMIRGSIWGRYLNNLYHNTSEVYTDDTASEVTLAQISALTNAFQDFEIERDMDGFVGCETPVNVILGDNNIVGYLDREYEDHFVESKCTRNPDFYDKLHNVTHQVGTYFLGNEQFEYCIVEAVRYPQLKRGQDEEIEQYEKRCYSDILKRPGHYFYHYDRKRNKFGRRFYRSEFDLEGLRQEYIWTLDEMADRVNDGRYARNYGACYVPGACAYLPICMANGAISDEIYTQKKKV